MPNTSQPPEAAEAKHQPVQPKPLNDNATDLTYPPTALFADALPHLPLQLMWQQAALLLLLAVVVAH
jgi:hypothetical protein